MKRAAAKRAPPAATLGAPVEIPLGDIVGMDSCNVRRIQADEAAIAALAEDIRERGLINPLVLRGSPSLWRVLAGGCRWRALLRVLRRSDLVRVRIFDGDDEEAESLSLAENVDRSDLHPLEIADHIAEAAARLSREKIARRHGRSERWVAERIALSGLPEVARAAWLRGEIGLPEAKALTSGTAAEIEALFARDEARSLLADPALIRRSLTPRGLSSHGSSARFVGLEAYERAGGAVKRDFFEDEVWLLDVDLLRRLERQALAGHADALCETEGWGHVYFDPGHGLKPVRPDFTDEEREEIQRWTAASEDDPARAEARERALSALEQRATLRAIPETDRARYGVYVGLDSEGGLDIVRGLKVDGGGRSPPLTAVDAAAPATSDAEAARPSPRASAPPAPAAAAEGPLILPFEARRLAEVAGSRALADVVGDEATPFRVVLQLVIAVWLATGRTGIGLNRMAGPAGAPGPLARELTRLRLAEALARLGEADDFTIWRTFREVVAASVDFRRGDEASAAAWAGFVDAQSLKTGFAALVGERLDPGAFAAAAGRAWALAMIRDCAGPAAVGERAWMKDEQIVAEAARLARAKSWAPEFLRGTK